MMHESEEPSGLKGWLLLVGLGVALSPVRLLRELYALYLPVFTDGTWAAFTDPASPDYTPYYAGSVIIEMLTDVAFFILSLWLAYLFFTKSPLFPKVFIGLLLASPAMIFFCYWLRTWPFPDETLFNEELVTSVILSCVPAVIWIPYMLLSKRVRNTFVPDPPPEE